MQNNPYIKILERALNIVQTEVVRISVEHLQLDNLLEERLVNIKLAVDYTSLLALETEKKWVLNIMLLQTCLYSNSEN